MNEYCERFAVAVTELKARGFARRNKEIASSIGVHDSVMSMIIHGTRSPNTDIMLRLCDKYPISIDWLRTGKGEMMPETMSSLRKKIAELEEEVRRLTMDNCRLRRVSGLMEKIKPPKG